MRALKLAATSAFLISAGVADAQSTTLKSPKVTTGVVVQSGSFDIAKLASGFVVQNGSFQSAKLSSGFVLEWQSFAASKLSIGIVVQPGLSSGTLIRAPLTHF